MGRKTSDFFEYPWEMGRCWKSGFIRNPIDFHVGLFQEIFSIPDPHGINIFNDADVGDLLEKPAEIERGNIEFLGDGLQIQIFLVVFIDVMKNLRDRIILGFDFFGRSIRWKVIHEVFDDDE